MRQSIQRACLALVVLAGGLAVMAPAEAGKADVVAVKVTRDGGGAFRFSVSVRHQDQGWHHYANAWEVVAPDGTVLGTRTLLHPHVREQPFTRGLGGVKIPAGVKRVTVRAVDSKHGAGGKEMTVEAPR